LKYSLIFDVVEPISYLITHIITLKEARRLAITAKELKNDEGWKYCEILKQFWIIGAEGGNTITRDNQSNSSATQLDGTRSIKRCFDATNVGHG